MSSSPQVRLTRVSLYCSVLASCILAGCAGRDGQARVDKASVSAPSLTGTAACFYPREVQDFRVLDRSNVILYSPNDANAYHLRVSPPSTELRFAESLAFLPAGGRICGYAGERLIVGPPTSAQRFAIIDVARLSPGSLQTLRGGSEDRAAPAARPRPGPGADVEGVSVPPAPGKSDSDGER